MASAYNASRNKESAHYYSLRGNYSNNAKR